MDFIRNQINRIQQQLAGLTPSQKMLAGALVVIMVATIYWSARYAGQTEMKALFDQVMPAEDIAAMTTALRVAGVQSTVTGGKIFVGAEDEIKAWSVLSYGQMLPRDTRNSFEDLLQKTSPFDPPSRTDGIMNEHRQNRLATMIRQYPGVASAMVLIDAKHERGPNGVDPKATVSMTLKRGETPTQQLVAAAADLVSGAVASLQRGKVTVIINGVSYPVRNHDEANGLAGSDEYLANVQKAEAYYHDKLAKHFNFIEGAFFSVSVTPNNKRVKTTEHKIDPKSVLQKPVSENTNTEESRSTARGGGEPGAVSNAPLTAGGAAETSAPEGSNTTTENNKTEYMVDHGHSDIETVSPGGDLAVTAAAIHVPRSYYVRAFQRKTNTDKEPDATALETFTKDELRSLTKGARSCLGLATDDGVAADVFWDLMPVAGSPAASPAAVATSSIALALTDHAKEVALGVLALISLFMVSNIVKKNAPVPVAAVRAPAPAPRELNPREEAVGEASEGVTALEGVELNDEEALGHQMQKQVADMVATDPDAAATLVKRWLNRG
ncbi:MAG: flagellar M-ring protein FliF C-terminal domain-containing protein [Tepidisphaeraceae bacterium]